MRIFYQSEWATLHHGHVLDVLRGMESESIQACVTSPPFYGLRAYGTEPQVWGGADCEHEWGDESERCVGRNDGGRDIGGRGGNYQGDGPHVATAPAGTICSRCGSWRGELGSEPTLDLFLANLVEVFREVKRVLRKDGCLWVNCGDSFKTGHRGTVGLSVRQDFADKQHELACGIDDKALPSYRASDYAYHGLCDECLIAWSIHIASISQNHPQASLLPEKINRDTVPQDSVLVDSDGAPHDVQVSTKLLSWLQSQGECSRCETRAALYQSLPHAFSGGAQVSARSALKLNKRDTSCPARASRNQDKDVFSAFGYSTNAILKSKDLMGVPWRLAFALQADGWFLRRDVIISKTNPLPESVTDRPATSHEYLFLLTRSATYFYDAEAVREKATYGRRVWPGREQYDGGTDGIRIKGANKGADPSAGRNLRSVWSISSEPSREQHFAAYPQALVIPPILASTSQRGACPACGAPWKRAMERKTIRVETSKRKDAEIDTAGSPMDRNGTHNSGQARYCEQQIKTLGWQVSCRCSAGEPIPCSILDPFCGTATTGVVAIRHGRRFVGIELSERYCRMSAKRLRGANPVLPLDAPEEPEPEPAQLALMEEL